MEPLVQLLSGGFLTGAKEATAGFFTGFVGFFGDMVGGAAGAVVGAAGMVYGKVTGDQSAYGWGAAAVNCFDFGGHLENYFKGKGVNTDSVWFTGGKTVGTIAGAGTMAALCPGTLASSAPLGAQMAGWASIYASQSFATNTKAAVKSVKNPTGADYVKAYGTSLGHAAITAATTVATFGINKGNWINKVGNKLGLPNIERVLSKPVTNAIVHGAGDWAHQFVDYKAGYRNTISKGEIFCSAATAAVGSYFAERGEHKKSQLERAGKKLGDAVEDVSKDVADVAKNAYRPFANTPVGKEIDSVIKDFADSRLGKAMATSAASIVDRTKNNAIIQDAEGGSHSYVIDTVKKVYNTVKNTKW